MLYAINWIVITALLALWSLAAWALHALAVWTVSSAGALPGAASSAGTLALPAWLAVWVPPDITHWASLTLAALAPFIDGLLQAAPALAGFLTVASWVVWSVGSVLLVLLGVGLHLLIVLLRRRAASGPGAGTGAWQPAG